MKVKFNGIDGLYAVDECGVVDLDAHEDQEIAVQNRRYTKFEKKELFWTIYDQIIIPTREQAKSDPDNTLRLLYIEDDGDTLIFHYSIDDYDESYCEVQGGAKMTIEEIMPILYDDFSKLRKSLPEDEPLKNAITWDKNRKAIIPESFNDRRGDVFYSFWRVDM